MRNHFEHFERLPRREKAHALKDRRDFGRLPATYSPLAADQIDISRESLNRLTTVVDAVVFALKLDAWKQLVQTKPDVLSGSCPAPTATEN